MQIESGRPQDLVAKPQLSYSSRALVLLATALIALTLAHESLATPAQPIKFNHQVHVKQMTCIFCHQLYETSEMAGRPVLARCMLCHAYPVSKSPEIDKLRGFAAANEQIPWVRLTRVQPFVRFSHQRHVVVGKVDCVACHGDIASSTEPPSRPLVAINMQLCLDCHTSKSVQLAPAAAQELKAVHARLALVDGVQSLSRKRFHSDADFLTRIAQLTGPLSEGDEREVGGQLRPAAKVSTDCFACHR